MHMHRYDTLASNRLCAVGGSCSTTQFWLFPLTSPKCRPAFSYYFILQVTLKENESYKAKHFKAGKYQNEEWPTILINPYIYAFCTVSNYLLMMYFSSSQGMSESIFRGV